MKRDSDKKAPGEAPGAANPLAQDPELLTDFILESREHLSSVEQCALTLEQDPDDAEAVPAIFRGFHTIKGLAGFLDLLEIQEVSHEVETALDHARNGRLKITPAVIDLILESSDYVKERVEGLEAQLNGKPAREAADNTSLIERIRSLAAASSPPQPQVEQDLARLSRAVTAVGPVEKLQPEKAPPSEAKAVKVDTAKLDFLVDMVGEMVIAQSLVRHDPELVKLESPRLLRNLSQLARITSDIQKTSMALRLVPIGHLFRRMARLVRDLSHKVGKSVELEVSGEETEIDRTIVEELADPLLHMLRNAVDHGVEDRESRVASGKPVVARVGLRAYHQSGHIVIEVSDDGQGLDRQKILAKARQSGLTVDHLTENEVLNLIFEPGLSTAARVTDVSGRGVGMDVARKQIQKLRGRIEIRSVTGQGTTFLLKLPLTLAIIDGLVIGVGEDRYILPMFAVREVFRPAAGAVSTIEDRDEMVLVRDRLLPVTRLHRKFHLRPRSEDPYQSLLIVTESESRPFCLMVDELIGKQEVVIKSLGETFKHVSGIAGSAILGDGRVGLILDVDGFFKDRKNDECAES